MGDYAEFGIIEEFDETKDYGGSYEPERYNCISIEDDWLNLLYKPLLTMRTYFHTHSRPEYSFARWGITLIPPESLGQFLEVVTSLDQFKDSEELAELANLLCEAKSRNKYVIHYGV